MGLLASRWERVHRDPQTFQSLSVWNRTCCSWLSWALPNKHCVSSDTWLPGESGVRASGFSRGRESVSARRGRAHHTRGGVASLYPLLLEFSRVSFVFPRTLDDAPKPEPCDAVPFLQKWLTSFTEVPSLLIEQKSQVKQCNWVSKCPWRTLKCSATEALQVLFTWIISKPCSVHRQTVA